MCVNSCLNNGRVGVVSAQAAMGLLIFTAGCAGPTQTTTPRSARQARLARQARQAPPPVRPRALPEPLPQRGAILDRRGRVLAAHAVRYNVYAVCRDLDVDGLEAVRAALGLKRAWLRAARARLVQGGAKSRGRATIIVAGLTTARWRRAQERLRRIRGVWVRPVLSRRYPLGNLASHVLGYLGEVSSAELSQGHRIRDRVGRLGVERLYERTLRGVFNGHGKPTTAGRRVVLTLDAQLQRQVEKALAPHPAAAAVVVEVQTGRILAMASRPGLDLRRLAALLSPKALAKLVNHPYQPFWDRAVMATVNPGATLFAVSGVAALESRSPRGRVPRRIRCTGSVSLFGRIHRCTGRHGVVSLPRALALGCRSWFFRAAQRMGRGQGQGLVLGLDRLARTARSFGLGQSSGLGLNDEATGSVPTAAWFKRVLKRPVHARDVLSVVIGQGQVTVTPLQLAMVYAAIANGGRLYHPRIVLRTERADGRLYRRFKPRLRRRLKISGSTLRAVRSGLRQAVTHAKGQARSARVVAASAVTGAPAVTGASAVAGVTVAGLAGNGQGSAHGYRHRRVSPHAWFAGYAPAKRPQVAVVVLIQNGGSGNRVAAPIAAQILRAYFSLKRNAPQIASVKR